MAVSSTSRRVSYRHSFTADGGRVYAIAGWVRGWVTGNDDDDDDEGLTSRLMMFGHNSLTAAVCVRLFRLLWHPPSGLSVGMTVNRLHSFTHSAARRSVAVYRTLLSAAAAGLWCCCWLIRRLNCCAGHRELITPPSVQAALVRGELHAATPGPTASEPVSVGRWTTTDSAGHEVDRPATP